MKRLISLSVTILLSTICATSAEPWGLEACIEYAVQNNLQIKQSELNVENQKLGVEQAKMNYIPTLGASAGYNANFGRSLDQTTYQFVDNKVVNNFNTGINLSTQVFAGLYKSHALRQSQLNLMASTQGLEKAKNDITLAVAAAYLQVLYNKEQIANNENQITLIESQIERTAKMVAAESVAKGALLDLQAQLASEQYNSVSFRNQHEVSLLNLSQLLELPSKEGFDIVVPLIEISQTVTPDGSVEGVYEKALSLPQIRQNELLLDAAKTGISIAQSRLYPTLSFSASYGSSFSDARQRPILSQEGQVYYEKYPFIDQLGDNTSGGLGLSLNIPIFSGLNAQRGVKTARIQKTQSEVSLWQSKNALHKEINQAWADALGALDRYRSAKASVEASQESFRYAENKLASGAISAVDYNVAKTTLANSISMMTQAKWEYIFKTKILDFYAGVPITI